jgi:two-component system chemotaxis response regulator CheY
MSTTAVPSMPAASVSKATILIVEDTPLWQKQIQQAISGAGYATLLAGDGMQALDLLQQHKPDVVVADVEMPRMGGLEFLKALRSLPQWKKTPVLMLTTRASKEIVTQAVQLQASGYMLKGSFSPDQLVDRVKKCLEPANGAPASAAQPAAAPKPAPSAFPRLLKRSDVLSGITAACCAGKTFQATLAQAIELCRQKQPNQAAILKIVKHDPIFAMRVLQKANEYKRIGTCEEALRLLNGEDLLQIAESIGVASGKPQRLLAEWQHSVAVANIMLKIVPRSFEMNAGVPYTIGLIHDLPEILFRQIFPSQFEVASDFASQAGRSLYSLLPDLFDVSIADLANEVATVMGLPPLLATPLREYSAAAGFLGQDPGKAAPMVDRLALALRYAEFYANGLGLNPSAAAFVAPLTVAECRLGYVSTDAIDGLALRTNAVTVGSELAGCAAEDAGNAPKSLKLWYVRHNSYAAFDPAEQALRLFADVQCHTEPPTKREHAAGIDGVVVSANAVDAFGMQWFSSDTTLRSASSRRLKFLFLLPPSGSVNSRASRADNVQTLLHPFSIETLQQSLNDFISN